MPTNTFQEQPLFKESDIQLIMDQHERGLNLPMYNNIANETDRMAVRLLATSAAKLLHSRITAVNNSESVLKAILSLQFGAPHHD